MYLFCERISVFYIQDEDVVEANSEDEKSWDPFDNEDMDEEVLFLKFLFMVVVKGIRRYAKRP